MKKHIFKRVLEAIPMLLFISFISYILMNLAPGDPAQGFRTPQMSEEQVAVIRASLGLDKPVFIRYFYWLKSTLSGNLGYSLITHQPVAKEILSRLPATLGLMGASMVLSILISIPLGMYTALNKNKFVDNFVSTLSYIGISIPSFWFSMILITIFALKLRLLPSVGMRTIGVNSFLDV
ncbi:MAG TPA: peptide permease, partial [Clostridium sp.]|nr:peptide permease [Clostridium sp.]